MHECQKCTVKINFGVACAMRDPLMGGLIELSSIILVFVKHYLIYLCFLTHLKQRPL